MHPLLIYRKMLEQQCEESRTAEAVDFYRSEVTI